MMNLVQPMKSDMALEIISIFSKRQRITSVSYTHLTLPTILRV